MTIVKLFSGAEPDAAQSSHPCFVLALSGGTFPKSLYQAGFCDLMRDGGFEPGGDESVSARIGCCPPKRNGLECEHEAIDGDHLSWRVEALAGGV